MAHPPLSREFLTELAERVIPRGYVAATSEQLVAAFHDKIGFLTASEWDELADVVVSGVGGSGADRLYDELLSKLRVLPDYDAVEQKLGRELADHFLECLEEVEYMLPDPDPDPRPFTRRELTEIVELMAILTFEDRDRVAAEYQKRKNQNREARRTADVHRIRRADELNIWFPYPQQRDEWLSDPKTTDQAPYFLELVDNVRGQMKGRLKHVPKKKLTDTSARDMERNMQSLNTYLTTTINPPRR